MIHNKEARELLAGFFHFSYNVYSLDELIDKLEDLQKSLPYKDEFGNFNEDHTDIHKVILQLMESSANIHAVMGLAYDKRVKDYMDECNGT